MRFSSFCQTKVSFQIFSKENFRFFKMSQLFNIFISILLLIILLIVPHYVDGGSKVDKGTVVGNTRPSWKIPIKRVRGFRTVNWCVKGDEPEFGSFPYSQFQYALRDTSKLLTPEDNINASVYTFNLYQIETKLPKTETKDSGLNFHVNIAHMSLKAEVQTNAKSENQPSKLQGLIVQANYNPHGIGLPTGIWYDDIKSPCSDCKKPAGVALPCRKRSKFSLVHPTILIWHYMMDGPEGWKGGEGNSTNGTNGNSGGNRSSDEPDAPGGGGGDSDDESDDDENEHGKGHTRIGNEWGPSDEIHGTFQWFFPPCVATRLIEFQILAVHSFEHGKFFHQRFGPFEMPYEKHHSETKGRPLNTPTPSFPHVKNFTRCDTKDLLNARIIEDYFEYSRTYDKCLRSRKASKSLEQECPSDPSHAYCTEMDDRQFYYPYQLAKCDGDYPCDEDPERFEHIDWEKRKRAIKRSLHGAINIFANFCFNPIFIIVARFYKETFNMHEYRGAKLWYWIHMLGSSFMAILMYFGYFQPGFVSMEDTHVILGNIFMFFLVISFCTAWARHKNHKCSMVVEFIHGFSGYTNLGLAIACLYTAPGMLESPVIICMWVIVVVFILFFIALEVHYFIMDNKYGVEPRRKHCPTIVPIFYDLHVPGNKARIIALIVFSCIVFLICFIMLFISPPSSRGTY